MAPTTPTAAGPRARRRGPVFTTPDRHIYFRGGRTHVHSLGEGEILDHGGRDGGGHGGEGHEGGGGGRVHEYYHPKTPGEIRIAARWQRLERERAEAENLLKSLDSQRKAWEDHYKGEQGLANARIRTWRVSSPTPYGESYMELRKL